MAYGPGSGALASASPNYVFPITIVDSIKHTLGPWKRRRWIRIRNRGLAMWKPAGLTFTIARGKFLGPHEFITEPWVPPFDDMIVLARNLFPIPDDPSTPTYDGRSDFGGYADVYGPRKHVGYYFEEFDPGWFKPDNRRKNIGKVAHEVGHALGFGHGGRGVMGGGWSVSDEELDLARAYYL